MARNYARVESGEVKAASCYILENSYRLKQRFRDLEDGVYRVSVTFDDLGACISIGRKIKSHEHEITRLSKQEEKRSRRARTKMPGIQGYQHMENMSTAALEQLGYECRSLIDWLKKDKPHETE